LAPLHAIDDTNIIIIAAIHQPPRVVVCLATRATIILSMPAFVRSRLYNLVLATFATANASDVMLNELDRKGRGRLEGVVGGVAEKPVSTAESLRVPAARRPCAATPTSISYIHMFAAWPR
jgi:hypothetical protein